MKIIGIIIAIAVIALGGYYLFMGTDNGVLDYGGGEDVVENGDVTGIFAKAKDISSIKYDVVMTSPAGVFNFKYYQKGDKIRSEMGEDGDMIISILNPDTGVYYSIMTSNNMAVELADEQIKDTTEGSPQNQAVTLSNTDLREVGKEKLNGKDTVIFEYQDDEGQTVTVWVWEDYGIPVKSSTYVEGWGELVAELGEIEFVEISDDMFILPEGVQIMSIDPSMMEFSF